MYENWKIKMFSSQNHLFNIFQSGSGTFDSLQTLVEVSSLLADQDGQYQVSVGVTL